MAASLHHSHAAASGNPGAVQKNREDEQRLTHAAAQASKPAFKAVWDNPDDDEYDRL